MSDLHEKKFNPYGESPSLIGVLEECIQNAEEPMIALLKIAKTVYYEPYHGWNEALEFIFRKYNVLIESVKKFFSCSIFGELNEYQKELTKLLTFLLVKNIIDKDYLTQAIVQNISDKQAKYALFSFLASWDNELAKKLDEQYVRKNFPYTIDGKNSNFIKSLILSSKEENYFSVILNFLKDPSTHYYFMETIQKILKDGSESEINVLEQLIIKLTKSDSEEILEFVCDLLELRVVKDFLAKRWESVLLERLYRNFSKNKAVFSEYSTNILLDTLNRLKNKQTPKFAIAAREMINKMSEKDKDFILQNVKSIADKSINDFLENLYAEIETNWDWKDCANFLVDSYIRKYGEEFDFIDVREIAADLGIEVIEHEFETLDFDACLARDNILISPIIFVNTFRRPKGRINFSIAHELGHAVIPSHANKIYFCNIEDISRNKFLMDKKLEDEANDFASHLLLPNKYFRKEVSLLNFSIDNVRKLSEKFRVSLVFTAKKWVQLSNLAIAMVVSTNGVIDWWNKSNSFPYILKSGSMIDKNSTVFTVLHSTKYKEVAVKKVDCGHWTEEYQLEYSIQEESIKIFDNKVLTLLQIVDEI